MAPKKAKKALGKKDMKKTKGGSSQILSPGDPATGQASGKRQHGAITITKEWDASTP